MASPQILPYVTEAAYAAWAGVRQRTIYPPEVVEGGPPLLFPDPEPGFYDLAALRYDFPAVTLTTLRDVVVRGGANTLHAPEGLLRHGVLDLAGDILPEEFYARLMIIGIGSATWAGDDPFEVAWLPEGAVFTDGVAGNYAHWMTEVLPRIAAFARDPATAAVPLIVDADLHPNILRSISLVAPDAPIYPLGPEQTLRVGVLHSVSPTGYVPFKLRAQSVETICHGLFGGQALRAAVAALKTGVAGAGLGEARPRLFIRRNATVRNLVNEAELAEALLGRGFEVIEPERLSLEDQVLAYSNAGMVVGATGAAITNLIFSRPDCPTVVLMPRFRALAQWYWRRMAAAAGAGPVLHVSGEQLTPLDDPFHPMAAHQDFRVEVQDVMDAVDAAEALRR